MTRYTPRRPQAAPRWFVAAWLTAAALIKRGAHSRRGGPNDRPPRVRRLGQRQWRGEPGLRLDGRFEERHDGELVFEGHYELIGDDVRLFEDGGGQLAGRLTEGRLSLTPPPRAQRRARHGQRRPSLHEPQPLY
jgi:hypothetical protein